MDLYIYYLYKLYLADSRYLWHIPVYNLHTGLQNTLVDMYKTLHRLVLYRSHLLHMVKDCKDYLLQFCLELLKFFKTEVTLDTSYGTQFLNEFYSEYFLTWYNITSTKWITSKSNPTRAHRTMINYGTFSINSARTRTRINTSFALTSSITRTFCIYFTFRSTIWCPSNIIWKARASRSITNYPTLRVWTARWWNTWIFRRSNSHNR